MNFLGILYQFLFPLSKISGRSQVFPGLIFSSFLYFKDEVVRDIQNIHIMLLLLTAPADEVVKLDS